MQETHRYDDIIDMEYPLGSHDGIRHPRMDMGERAKIFSPFAALKGYEEAIEAKAGEAGTDHSYETEIFVDPE